MIRPSIEDIKHIPEDEVESRARASMPPIVFKYRSWKLQHHKSALLNTEIWFSSPKELNDLYDIRLAYKFNPEEIHTPEFFNKLREVFPSMTTFIQGTRDFEIALQNHFDYVIKPDPIKWFHKNQADLRNGPIYERLGLFSTTKDPLSMVMWAYYAESYSGISIGYDPYVIWNTKHSICGIAHYIKEPLEHSFIKESEYFIDLFIKNERWEHEQEYRFVTFVQNDKERLVQLPLSAIKEVILGKNISKVAEDEVVNCLRNRYNSKVKLLKVQEGHGETLILSNLSY
jgi:hypothetical protein